MGIFDVPITDEQTLYLDPIYEGMALSFLASEEVRKEYYEDSAQNRGADGFRSNVDGLCSNLEKLSDELAKHPCSARYRNEDGSFKDDYILKLDGKPVLNRKGEKQFDVAKVRYAEGDRFDKMEAKREKFLEEARGISYKNGGDIRHRDALEEAAMELEVECIAHSKNPIFFGPIEESWRLWGGTKHTRKEIIEDGDLLGFEALKDKFISELRGPAAGRNEDGERVDSSTGFHNGENIPAAASALYTSVMLRLQGDTQYVASQIYDAQEVNGEIVNVQSPLIQSYKEAWSKVEGNGYETVWRYSTSRAGVYYQDLQATKELLQARKVGRTDVYMPKIDKLTEIRAEYQREYDRYQGQTHAIQTADVKDDVKQNLQRYANQQFEQYTAQAHIDITKAEGRYSYDAKNPAIHPSIGKGLIIAGVLGVSIASPLLAIKYAGVSIVGALAIDGTLLTADLLWHDQLCLLFYTEDELKSGQIKSEYLVPLSSVDSALAGLYKTSDLRLQEIDLNKAYNEVKNAHDEKGKIFNQKVAEYRSAEKAGASDEELDKLFMDLDLEGMDHEVQQLKGELEYMETIIQKVESMREETTQEFRNNDHNLVMYYHDLKLLDGQMQGTMDRMGFTKLFEVNEGEVRDLTGDKASDNMAALAEKDARTLDPIRRGGHILAGQELKDEAIEYLLDVHTAARINPKLSQKILDEEVTIGRHTFRRIDTSLTHYLAPDSLIRSQNDTGEWISDKVCPNGSILTQENARLEAAGRITIDPLMKADDYRALAAIQRWVDSKDPQVAERAWKIYMEMGGGEIIEASEPSTSTKKEEIIIEPQRLQRATAYLSSQTSKKTETDYPEKAEEQPIPAANLPKTSPQTSTTPSTGNNHEPPQGATR